jgi:hypothetical protein
VRLQDSKPPTTFKVLEDKREALPGGQAIVTLARQPHQIETEVLF